MANVFEYQPDVTGTSNYSLFGAIITEVAVTLTVTAFFTGARLIAKRSFAKFHIEDYLSIIALSFLYTFGIVLAVAGSKGLGTHMWNFNPSNSSILAKLMWVLEIMYSLGIMTAKAAILCQLQRIFSPSKSGRVFIACQVLLWFNVAFYFSSTVAVLAECVPTDMIWNSSVTNGHCIDNEALLVTMAIINIVSNVSILVLPIWAIFHLQITLNMKLGISAVFATGLIAVVCSICRLIYTFRPLNQPDTTYLFAPVAMWSLAEVASIILCTCFPMMPRFYHVVTKGTAFSASNATSPFPSPVKSTFGMRQSSGVVRKSSVRCSNCIHDLPCVIHSQRIGSFSDKEEDHERHRLSDPVPGLAATTIEEEPEPEPDSEVYGHGAADFISQNPVQVEHSIIDPENRFSWTSSAPSEVVPRPVVPVYFRPGVEVRRNELDDSVRLSIRTSVFDSLHWEEAL